MVEHTGLQISRVKDLVPDVLNISSMHLVFRGKNCLKQLEFILSQFGGKKSEIKVS